MCQLNHKQASQLVNIMPKHTLFFVHEALASCLAAQDAMTTEWHIHEPEDTTAVCPKEALNCEGSPDVLLSLVLAQHLMNFKLWHVEDQARRKDVGDDLIAWCKRTIDGYNQRRNDFMEKVDACVVNMCLPNMPDTATRYNTESLGAAIDRLSILSLKAYHMQEETDRKDASTEHIEKCRQKLAVLKEQRRDLFASVLELIDDYATGLKRPKVYYQFKMYNDPTLNPALYTNSN